MFTITLTPTTYTSYNAKFRGTTKGSVSDSEDGAISQSAAEHDCKWDLTNKANNAANYASVDANQGPISTGISHTLDFGDKAGSRTTSIGSPSVHSNSYFDDNGDYWWQASGTCSWSVTVQNAYLYQLKLKFEFPTGLTINDIESAYISLEWNSTGTGNRTISIAAPNSNNELNEFWDTHADNPSTIIADTVEWENSGSYIMTSIPILDVIEACYQYNQPYFVLRTKRTYPASSSHLMTLTQLPTITLNTSIPMYSYTLTFVDNTNEATNMPFTIITADTNNTHSFIIPDDIPHREGYSFIGWTTNSNSNTVTHIGGDTIVVTADSTTTLYPVWTRVYGVGVIENGLVVKVLPFIYDSAYTYTHTALSGRVKFTIDGIECKADDNMTWVNWINSEYNILGCYLNDNSNYIFLDVDGTTHYIDDVVKTDLIVPWTNYTY